MTILKQRRIHALTFLACITAVFAGLASPASAGAETAATVALGCTWEDTQFTSLGLLTEVSAARGSGGAFSQREKPQLVADTEISADDLKSLKPSGGVIEVYFHVITTTSGRGYVSPATVQEQIRVLNQTFASTGFTFVLVDTDYTANNAWFAQATFEDEVAMKSALREGDHTDLNIYTTSGGGYLGWAYYPKTVHSKYAVLDGVVLHYGSLPGGYIPNYNLGYTATHEVGHWLGLAHTFEFGCQGHGDFVKDTPDQAVPTEGCPVYGTQDTCPGEGVDPVNNYMDYSYDICYTQFTPGQAERMQKMWAHWRVKRAA